MGKGVSKKQAEKKARNRTNRQPRQKKLKFWNKQQSNTEQGNGATGVDSSSASPRNDTSSFGATGVDSSSAPSRNSTSSFDATGDDSSSAFMEDNPQEKGLFNNITTTDSVLDGQMGGRFDDHSTEKQSSPITFNVSLVKGDPQTGITLGKVLLGAAILIGLTALVIGTGGAAGALPFAIEATQSLLALVELALAPKLALGIVAGVGLLTAGAAGYKLNLGHKLGHAVSSLFGGKQGRDAGNGGEPSTERDTLLSNEKGGSPSLQRESDFFEQEDGQDKPPLLRS